VSAAPARLDGRRLTVRFGGVTALDGVDLRVEPGEAVGLIGPNGAGKTTLFNLVSGLVRPTSGSLAFAGQDLSRLAPWRIARLGILRTFQTLRLFPNLSVMANVMAGRHMHSRGHELAAIARLPAFEASERRQREACLAALERVGLASRADDIARTLPYGDQRRLELARALAGEPRLLLLDEPAAGMNPRERTALAALVRGLNRQDGIGLLVVEHDIRFVAGVADRVVVLDHGEVLAEGSPEAVRANPKVVEAYLGHGRIGDRAAGREA
jgi:branched-chain amino acid transport system ATP-binding protein